MKTKKPKILVIATQLSTTSTSAGLNVCKLVNALAENDFEVVCLADYTDQSNVNTWQNNEIKIVNLQKPTTQFYDFVARVYDEKNKKIFLTLLRKFLALIYYLTGFDLLTHKNLNHWKKHIQKVVAAEKPDMIFVRGSGMNFMPHWAMTYLNLSTPWIAYYHDPFPKHLYPPPYNENSNKFVAFWEEQKHRRILNKSAWLAFPSERLAHWIIDIQNPTLWKKTVIIPHPGGDLRGLPTLTDDYKTTIDKYKFTLLHSGTLLKERYPECLIKAYQRFLQHPSVDAQQCQLVFVGKVYSDYLATDECKRMEQTENLKIFAQRVSYQRSLELSTLATVLVIVEANTQVSPFFPGKLADCIWLNKPILALTPEQSTTTDLLGAQYPYKCEANNEDAIYQILLDLWYAWQHKQLDTLNRPDLTKEISPKNISHIIKKLSQ